MKRFAFSLQNLLDTRIALERAAEQDLLSAQKDLAEGERKALRLEKERLKYVRELERVDGVVERKVYSTHVRNVDTLQLRVERHQSIIDRLDKHVDAMRQKLQAAMSARRIMEKLHDREEQEWLEAMLYAEQKQMDELAACRWARQGGTA